MLTLSQTLKYYKRPEIQAEMVEAAKNKEVAIRYEDQFGSRPDVLRYPNDILELAKSRATSFHISEERWTNPLLLGTSMSRKELDSLRTGWDLVIDLDCKFIEYSKIAADLAVKFLKHQNIKAVSIKFSGNKGFHIGVPFESFPQTFGGKPTSLLFPEGPHAIANYISAQIREPLNKAILAYEKGSFKAIVEKTGKMPSEIQGFEKNKYGDKVPVLNAEPFLNIDTILISSRHLYRMPYSMHEKSGLASIPIDPDKVLEFERPMASPEQVMASKFKFLDSSQCVPGEAGRILMQAFDSAAKPKEQEKKAGGKESDMELPKINVLEEYYPPCIKKILEGVEDGRKRSLFILANFFSSLGWDNERVEKEINAWNQKNREPLKEVYVKGQLHYNKYRKEKVLPPNCDNRAYYIDMGVHLPDSTCQGLKNPINYVYRKARRAERLARFKKPEPRPKKPAAAKEPKPGKEENK